MSKYFSMKIISTFILILHIEILRQIFGAHLSRVLFLASREDHKPVQMYLLSGCQVLISIKGSYLCICLHLKWYSFSCQFFFISN